MNYDLFSGRCRTAACLTSLSGILTFAGPAFAQDAPSGDDDAFSNEILVSAQRREERLIDVPISVSAVSGDELKSLGVTQPTQLVNLVPGLQFENTGPTYVFSIRGISLNDYGDANESPIALYRDDVYLGALGGTMSQMFDIDRVEVLRGPQGTLFGRNSTGGLIHIVSKQPTDKFDAQASVQYGSYNQVIVEAAIGGPLTDRLRSRTAGQYDRDDGWQLNLVNGKRFAKTDSWALRQILDYDVTDDLLASINIHGGRANNVSPIYSLRGTMDPISGDPCSTQAILALQCVNDDGFSDPDPTPEKAYSNHTTLPLTIDTFGVDGYLTYTGDGITVNSITAFERTNKYYEEDGDGPGTLSPAVFGADRDQFSQELRASGESGAIKWVAGVYYFEEQIKNGLFDLPSYVALYGTTYGLRNQFEQKTRSGAVFGQLDYALSDALTLTAGARYTREHKALTISDDFSAPNYIDNEKVTLGRATWKLGASWKFDDDLLAYASISTGFKSPAFNTTGSVQGGSVASAAETSTNYEIGFKGSLADRMIQFSTAAFYLDYKNFQAVSIPQGATLPISVLTNLPKAEIYGLEAEVHANLAQGLSFSLNATRLWPKIVAPGVLFDGVPLDGQKLVAATDWTLKGVVAYRIDLGSAGTVTPRLDASYRSVANHSLTGNILSQSPAYALVNGGISWAPDDSHFTFELLAQNLFDKHYLTYAYVIGDNNALQWGSPRTFAGRVSFAW